MKKIIYAALIVAIQHLTINVQNSVAQLPNDNIGAGNGLGFDGVNDFVSIPSVQMLNDIANAGNSVTHEMWVNVGIAGTYSLLSKMHTIGSGDQELYAYVVLPTGLIDFKITTGAPGGGISYFTTSHPIVPNQWTHLAITHTYGDGTSTRVYINGELAAGGWVQDNGDQSVNSTNTNPLVIGTRQINFSPLFFSGQIDDVRIWNVTRTQAQIRDNMNRKLMGNETGLVGYWNMNEGTGATVNDLTSNANHGTRQ